MFRQEKMIVTRAARESDAKQICGVLRRSIVELCTADHRGDEHILGAWLANKTSKNVLAWMRNPDSHFVVAENGGQIVGVGAATARGEITLNYVDHEARFQGVSKAILGSLEAYLSKTGNTMSFLTSTQTAHRFYQSSGYHDTGAPTIWASVTGYPMEKDLLRNS